MKCLEECLKTLPPKQANLIMLYYREQKKAKIESHKAIGNTLNVKAGALRARVFRVREKLKKCIDDCLKRTAAQ
jgi:DNA-directed RNA polymerase specialized sigma24 family protein